jgi:hypothetical protein
MADRCFVGIDTSNYTTSVAIADEQGRIVANLKAPLPVKAGERGLRQSDAVFAHVKNLPELMQVKLSKLNQKSGTPVSVSGFAKAPKLGLLTIYDCTVSGLESFVNPKLRRISLRNVKGITSLEGLKACPDLYQIEIQNCDIPDSALQGFNSKVKITKR